MRLRVHGRVTRLTPLDFTSAIRVGGVSPARTQEHQAELVIVANRLPVDRVVNDDGSTEWRRSPGGLVTAIEPVMRRHNGAWVGWPGGPNADPVPFVEDDMFLVPISLSEQEIRDFYERSEERRVGKEGSARWTAQH